MTEKSCLNTGKKCIRVIGCGNLLMGNDSAGLRVLDILEKSCSGLELIEGGTGGIGLLPLIEGADLVIIADAMTGICKNPGDIRIFAETPPYKPSRMPVQDIGVAEVIDIARELNPGTEIIAVGIEAGTIAEYSDKIDPGVMEGVRNASILIMDVVDEKDN